MPRAGGVVFMRLHQKLILWAVVPLASISVAGAVWLSGYQQEEFLSSVSKDMGKCEAFLDATRTYVQHVARPAVARQTSTFVGEAQSPDVALRGIFQIFRQQYPEYQFHEAADNPLNLADKADADETKLLISFRENRGLRSIRTFLRDTGGREWYVGARPIVADASCMHCHGSAHDAPVNVARAFGSTHGYGWKPGDVAAVQTVRIPTAPLRAAQAAVIGRAIVWLGALSAMILLTVYLAALSLLCVPVRRIAQHMGELAQTRGYDRELAEASRGDEIGVAARAFNSLLQVIRRTLLELKQANDSLEARVEQRTSELKKSNNQLVRTQEELRHSQQAAERANKAKDEFLANMSHEIRTPMTAIIGYADVMLEPDQTISDRYDALLSIRRNARHLLDLINDVLDISKIEAGQMTVERVSSDLPQLVAEVASLLRPRVKDKGLDLDVRFDGPVPQQIRTDPLRLRQVLVNLLSNAAKFTDKGQVTLRVALRREGNQPSMVFEVSDTGIGIAPEHLTRLFRRFTQADTTTTRRFGGSGLGLCISKHLAGLLGGDISVRSTPGHGSSFTVTIDPGDLAEIQMVDGATEAARAHGTVPTDAQITIRGRILLAEDGPDNQRLISRYLSRAGAEVVVADNGRAAVEQVMSGRFDLVLMDMQMPVMDGYAATSIMRSRGVRLPIVALTAHAMADDRAKCLASGCDDYLSKPVDKTRLLMVLKQYLERQVRSAPSTASGQIVSRFANEQEMAEVLAKFVAELPVKVAEISALVERQELTALKRLAHQIKGSGGGYGFPEISEAAARVENRAAELALDSATQEARQLISLIRRVRGYDTTRERTSEAQ